MHHPFHHIKGVSPSDQEGRKCWLKDGETLIHSFSILLSPVVTRTGSSCVAVLLPLLGYVCSLSAVVVKPTAWFVVLLVLLITLPAVWPTPPPRGFMRAFSCTTSIQHWVWSPLAPVTTRSPLMRCAGMGFLHMPSHCCCLLL